MKFWFIVTFSLWLSQWGLKRQLLFIEMYRFCCAWNYQRMSLNNWINLFNLLSSVELLYIWCRSCIYNLNKWFLKAFGPPITLGLKNVLRKCYIFGIIWNVRVQLVQWSHPHSKLSSNKDKKSYSVKYRGCVLSQGLSYKWSSVYFWGLESCSMLIPIVSSYHWRMVCLGLGT